MLSRFHTIPACHGQTDRWTDRHTDRRTELLYQYRASAAVCWRAIKIVATICQIFKLKCAKFNFSWGSLYSAGLRDLLLREGRGGNRKGRGEEGEVTLSFLSPPLPSLRSKGGEGRDPTPSRPLIHISGYAPEIITIITPIMSCYHYNTTRNHSESANFGHDI